MNSFLQSMRGSADGLPPDQKIAVVVFFLLLMLVGILLIGLFFVWLATRQARARRLAGLVSRRAARSADGAGSWRFQTALFDSPCRWLAVRSNHPPAVQTALNLHNPAACSWEEGLAEAGGRRLFISPPIGD